MEVPAGSAVTTVPGIIKDEFEDKPPGFGGLCLVRTRSAIGISAGNAGLRRGDGMSFSQT